MDTDLNPNVSSKTLVYYACFMLILTGVVVYTSWNSSVQKQSNAHDVGDPLLTQNKITHDLVYKVESYTDGWIQWCIAVLFRCHAVFV